MNAGIQEREASSVGRKSDIKRVNYATNSLSLLSPES